jgi:hypothetical protein
MEDTEVKKIPIPFSRLAVGFEPEEAVVVRHQ